jgi:beta-lactamase class A
MIVGSIAATSVTVLGAAACSSDRDSAEGSRDTTAGLRELEAANKARIGVYARDLRSGHTVAHRADDSFAICSTFKAYLVARVLQLVERDELSLATPVYVDPGEIKTHSPVTQRYAGGPVDIGVLCRAAVQESDNTAANLLLRAIGGPPGLTAFARSIGDERTRLDRWETELNSAIPGDPRDTSTPAALAGGFTAILVGDEVLAVSCRQELTDWMLANQTSSMRVGLSPGWTSADKTGGGDYGSTNDVGLVMGPDGQRVMVAVMIRSTGDNPEAPGYRPLVGEVTKAVLADVTG